MIDFIRPRFFIMENVKGLISAPLKTDAQDANAKTKFLFDVKPRLALEVILEEFEKLGYKTVCGLLDAINYGVPQFRERFILLGSRDGEDIFLPAPTHFARHQNGAYRWKTLRSAVGDLENETDECASFGEERSKYLRLVPEGGNWRDLPEDVVEAAMGGAYRSSGGKIGFYRRLSYDQPSPTLVTSPIQKASMLCHPTQTRPLSVREYARIQQFPDDWAFYGSVAAKYRQIGNAVPVGLGKALGEALIAVAEGSAAIKTKRFRGASVHQKMQEALLISSDSFIPSNK